MVFAGFCAFVDLYAPQPLLPQLTATFGKSPAEISLLVTVSTLAVAFAAPFVGSLADRWGRKQVIVPATLLLTVPTLLAATAHSFGMLLFWRFWQGLFTPGIFAITVTYINEEWTENIGKAMGAYVSGTILGGFSGRMIAALVAARLPWQWTFVILGLLNAAGGLAIWRWLPAGRRHHFAPGDPGRALLRHLRNRPLVATCGVGFCILFTLVAAFTYVNF